MTSLRILTLCCLVPLAACATTQSVKTARLNAGTARAFPDSLERVAEAASRAVPRAGLTVQSIEQPDSQTVMVMATGGMSFLTYGEVVRVLLQAQPDGGTSVRVYTAPRLGTNLTYKRWDDDVLGELGRELALRASHEAAAGRRPVRWTPSLEALRSLQPDAGVRVALRDGRRESGRVLGVTDSALGLASGALLPAAAIDSLWVRHTRGRTGFVIGSILGGVAGVILGIRHSNTCASSGSSGSSGWWTDPCLSEGLLITTGVTAAGSVLGVAVGQGIPDWKLRFP